MQLIVSGDFPYVRELPLFRFYGDQIHLANDEQVVLTSLLFDPSGLIGNLKLHSIATHLCFHTYLTPNPVRSPRPAISCVLLEAQGRVPASPAASSSGEVTQDRPQTSLAGKFLNIPTPLVPNLDCQKVRLELPGLAKEALIEPWNVCRLTLFEKFILIHRPRPPSPSRV